MAEFRRISDRGLTITKTMLEQLDMKPGDIASIRIMSAGGRKYIQVRRKEATDALGN